jgi:hypothetical protein
VIEKAGISAFLQFDCGSKAQHSVMTLAKITPNENTVQAGITKDKLRLEVHAARNAGELQKRKWVSQRQASLCENRKPKKGKVDVFQWCFQ